MNVYRILIVPALLGLLCGGPASAQQPPPPEPIAADDPRAVRATELIRLFTAGDRAGAAAYLRTHAAPSYGEDRRQRHLDIGLMEYGPELGLGIDRLERIDTNVLVHLRSGGGVTLNALVMMEAEPPYRLTGLGRVMMRGEGGAGPGADGPRLNVQRVPPEEQAVRELDEYLSAAARDGRLSGAVLLAREGRPLLERAYGQANRERGVPNTADTKFALGSMNKMFTAVAIAQLVERGLLSFDDPVAKFLPSFPTREAAARIRIQHLLSHTSGLETYSPLIATGDVQTVAKMLEVVGRQAGEPAFEPGTSWRYSNTGFLVLGAIIEQVTGQSYYDYIRANIYEPAGMRHTDTPEIERVPADLARRYVRTGDAVQHSVLYPRGGPAGGGYSTLGDMLRFAEALRTHRLLKPETTQLVLAPKPELGANTYGFGFGSFGDVVGHNGGEPGAYANLHLFPATGHVSVVFLNVVADPRGTREYENRIRELVGTLAPARADTSRDGGT